MPHCSIIIATYGRPGALQACLHAIGALATARGRFEVIVVDDGGDTPLGPMLDGFRDRLDLILLRQDNAGPGAARNHGAARARGTLLAFTDDDCRPEPDWLDQLLAAAGEPGDGVPVMLGGLTVNALGENPYAAASQWIQDIVYRHYNADPGRARFFASNNLLVSRAAFLSLGGFDARFRTAEDRDLCDRWRQAGLSMRYLPAARVRHAHALSFRGFCRQHFGYGRGARRYHLARAARGSGTMLQESGFHLHVGNWLWSPLRQGVDAAALRLMSLLVIWQIANAAGFFWEWAFADRRPAAPRAAAATGKPRDRRARGQPESRCR